MNQTVHLKQKAQAIAIALAIASMYGTVSFAQSQESRDTKEMAKSAAVPSAIKIEK